MTKFVIYCFLDDKGYPYYIGQTYRFKKRKQEHLKKIKKGSRQKKYLKTRKLIKKGWPLTMVILHTNLSKVLANILEKTYILQYKRYLCNYNKRGVSKGLIKHGKIDTQIYRAWNNMRARCNNLKNKEYTRYGGRGITVCTQWENFEKFYEDMGDPPTKKHSLDRIDSNGGYNPDNCRWATMAEQARNTSRNKNILYGNKAQTLIDWSKDLKISYPTLRKRLKDGWTIIRAFKTPINNHLKNITYQGETKNIKQWAKKLNIAEKTLRDRLISGWTIKKAFTTSPNSYVRKITFNQKAQTITEWAKELGFSDKLLRSRLKKGWSIEKTLMTPSDNHINKYMHEGKNQTLSEWSKELNINRNTLKNWLRKYSISEIIKRRS